MSLFLLTETAAVILCALLYFVMNTPSSIVLHFLFIGITAYIAVGNVWLANKRGALIGFVSIANFFAVCIFVLRPMLLYSGMSDISRFSTLRMYATLNGMQGYTSLPLAKASLIGLIGVYAMNVPFARNKRQMNISISKELEAQIDERFTLNQKMLLVAMYAAIILFAVVYYLKQNSSIGLSIIDMVWVFIAEVMIAYLICRKRKATLVVYLTLAACMVLLAMGARRQYIVNLLLCFVVPIYMVGKNRKATFRNIAIMGVAIFVIVHIYGEIRRSRIGEIISYTFVESILGEFCMFDMLAASLDYTANQHMGLFWGYNYLTVFTTPIPGISIQPFDHYLTEIVSHGSFGGAIPTSLFGSLYFNFSYIGVAVGGFLLGKILMILSGKCRKLTPVDGVVQYAILSTFVYDIVRVGDIGRELWSLITVLLVKMVFMWVMKRA